MEGIFHFAERLTYQKRLSTALQRCRERYERHRTASLHSDVAILYHPRQDVALVSLATGRMTSSSDVDVVVALVALLQPRSSMLLSLVLMSIHLFLLDLLVEPMTRKAKTKKEETIQSSSSSLIVITCPKYHRCC